MLIASNAWFAKSEYIQSLAFMYNTVSGPSKDDIRLLIVVGSDRASAFLAIPKERVDGPLAALHLSRLFPSDPNIIHTNDLCSKLHPSTINPKIDGLRRAHPD
jgi:hypothetical protein